MKKLLTYILCWAYPCLVMAQGWVIKDATLVVKDNAHVVINEPSGHYTSKGTSLVLTRNKGNIHVDGDWVNNGSSPAIGNNDGTVILSGAVQQITGTTSTKFNDLELAGSANKVLAIETLVGGGYSGTRTGKLKLNDKSLSLNSNLLIINNPSPNAIERSLGLLIGDTDPTLGYGKVQWTLRNATSGSALVVPFGTTDFNYVPLTIAVQSPGIQVMDSGYVTVATYPTNTTWAPNNRPLPIGVSNFDNEYAIENDVKSVDRFYVVSGGAYNNNPELSFGFSYVDREWDASLGSSNDIDEAELEAARFNGTSGLWDYTLRGSTSAATNQTTSESTRDYVGAWVLYNSPYCPVPHFTFSDDCFKTPILFTDSSYIEIGTIDTTVWEVESLVSSDQN
ncbi:MAG: hypothetical protein JJ975_05740, partial [Bacteroidia bacterium]|nr:hypothetical protein [Bacteroidia bacterium]